MALITLLLMAAWALFVVRLFAVGATLSDRTYLVYIALGALMAVSASPLAEKFIIPYPLGDYGYGYTGALFRVAVRNLTLLMPVVTFLFVRRTYRLISIADAFGLAFAVGFGFELTGAVLASSVADNSLRGMTLFPPWQFTWDPNQRFPILGVSGDFAMVSAAYSTGFVALVLAAGMRFWRVARKTILVSALVFLFITAHEAFWMSRIMGSDYNVPAAGFARFYDLIMYHGRLVALLTLAGLLYLTERERRWIAGAKGESAPAATGLLDELQSNFFALLKHGPRGYAAATESGRRHRQLDVINAERSHSPDDHPLFQSARLLDIKLGREPGVAVDDKPEAAASSLERWGSFYAWSGLALVVVVMPWLPQRLVAYLWTFPLFNISLVVVPFTVLQLGLLLIVLWWFLHGPYQAQANWDPEEVFRFQGHNAISYAAMGLALLVLFHIPLNNFYPPFSTLAFLNRASFPPFDSAQIPVLMLLLASVAIAFGFKAAARWRREASPEQQRASVVRKAIVLANAVIFMWIGKNVYVPMLASLQQALGPTAFTVFGRFGNVVVALCTIVLFFGVSLVIGYVLRALSQRVEEFLLRSPAEKLETAGG